ncbi:MAG: nuclear transport factor 2 family protein [Pseudomonadales bacterium]|nr:nuclear transport factor 2 family protein [Pseudomonadales bacterium]
MNTQNTMGADIYEIQKLLYLYCEHLDRGDFEGMAELFANARLATSADNPDVVNDPAAIVAMYQAYTRIYPHTGTPGTKHTVSNPIIDISPDGLSAVCRSYIVVFQGVEDFPLQPVFAGRYLDRFEKVNGTWRYSEREIVSEHFGNMSRHMLQPFGPDTIKPAN